MMTTSIKALKAIPMLTHLRAADLKEFARVVEERAYANRKAIFREGSRCEAFYFVKAGQVKLLRSNKDREQLLAILSAGEPLDLVPLLDGGSHSCTAIARGPVTVYVIDSKSAHDFIWNTPQFLSAILNAVSGRLRNLANLASDLAFKDVSTRVCKILLDQAHSEGKRTREGIRLKRNLSQSEFASLAGTAREVAWRALKKLEEDGLLKIERHQITLLDPKRLTAMV